MAIKEIQLKLTNRTADSVWQGGAPDPRMGGANRHLSEGTPGETLAWKLQYVRTRSVALDMKIVLVMLRQVIAQRGTF
jgi:hypothetical protein